MYEYLKGILTGKSATEAVIDVGGMGFRLEISLRCSERLPRQGAEVMLLVHHRLQDDRLRFFGFLDEEERTLFRQLLGVAGIGPAHALALLSGQEPAEVWRHVQEGEWKALANVKGIGPKIAQRACTELKDRARRFAKATVAPTATGPAGGARFDDAVGALLVLGYSEPQAQKAVEAAAGRLPSDAPLEALIREALHAS